jgi:hypothetical protein
VPKTRKSKVPEDQFFVVLHSLVAMNRRELYDSYTPRRLSHLFAELDRILSINRLRPNIEPVDWSVGNEQQRDTIRRHPELSSPDLNKLERGIFEIENNPQEFIKYFDAPNYFRDRYLERQLHESPPFDRSSRNTDIFFRYSIMRNDPRIGPAGELSAGTYAAPASDAAFVPSGFAAVGRYALPALLPRC